MTPRRPPFFPASPPTRRGPRADDDDVQAPEAERAPAAHPKRGNPPELKVSGRNACRALFEARRQDVRRVYVTEENVKAFGDVLHWCAQERIAYHLKTKEDLHQISETVHHDGVLMLAREKSQPTLSEALERRDDGAIVLLEDVKNPHNLGAILRVCAHFGVRVVLAAGNTPTLSAAVMRTAEGGAEHVSIIAVDAASAIATLRTRGYRAIATSSHASAPLGQHATPMPARALIMFGSESHGLSAPVLKLADATVAIEGRGSVESLNVACAASVLLWEHQRTRERALVGQQDQQTQRAPQPVRAQTVSPSTRREPSHKRRR